MYATMIMQEKGQKERWESNKNVRNTNNAYV